MTRSLTIALMAAFALHAAAEDTTTSQSMSGTPKAPKAAAKPAKPPAKLTPVQERIRALDIAKVKFMSAVGACPKPEDCDPESPRKNPELIEMLKKGEDAYMEACVQCATDKACEQERDRIRAGRGRMGQNLCSEQLLKQLGKDAKKPSGPGSAPAKPAAQPSK